VRVSRSHINHVRRAQGLSRPKKSQPERESVARRCREPGLTGSRGREWAGQGLE
jgi:hypothetical protein